MSESSVLIPEPKARNIRFPEPPSAKEEKTRKALRIALGIAGAVGLYFMMPTLINFAGNIREFLELVFDSVLYGIGVAVLGGTSIWLLRNKAIHALIRSIADAQVKKLTALWATIDPIAILDQYVEYLNYQIERFDYHLARLKAQIMKQRKFIEENAELTKAEVRRMQAAHKSGDEREQLMVNVFYKQKKRLDQSTMTAQGLLKTMETLMRALLKMREVAGTLVLDITNEVEQKKRDRAMILEVSGATNAARSAMYGDPNQKALYDEAMKFLTNDYFNKLAELENFIQGSEYFILTNDIEKQQIGGEALEFLAEWEKKGDSLLLSNSEREELFSHEAETGVFDLDREIAKTYEKPKRATRATLGKKWTADL